jgi:hypothetical protein
VAGEFVRISVLFFALLASAVSAGDYQVSVTRKGSNLYKVDGKDMFIHTRYCYEYVYYSDVVLRMSGYGGTIDFLEEKNSCAVKGVYAGVTLRPGKYNVTVSREDDDWYHIDGTEQFIKTAMCLSLALGEDSLLKVDSGSFGTVYFLDDRDNCQVEGIYERKRL